MSARKKLGVVDALYNRPLTRGLVDDDGYDRMIDIPARHAIALRNRDIDLAFVTPVDYARESSGYRIIPGVGVSSAVATGSVSLFFREEHPTVASVAIDPSSASEIVLARIVLAEEFDLEPTFIPVAGSLDDMLARADAALLSGDASLRSSLTHPQRIDLVEMWNDLTGLPYVHLLLAGHEDVISPGQVRGLRDACLRSRTTIDAIVREADDQRAIPPFSRPSYEDYLHAFSYALTDEDLDGLKEFFRYAFYHGVVPDIADINLFPTEDPPADVVPPMLN